MKTRIAFCLLPVLIMLSQCTAPDTTESDRAAIMAVHDAWLSATQQLDIEANVALWADDAVAMQPDSPPFTGLQGIRDRIQFYREVSVGDLNVTVEEFEVGGDWGFIRQRFQAVWTAVDGSESVNEDSKEIMIFKRGSDNTWRIARYIWNANPPVVSE